MAHWATSSRRQTSFVGKKVLRLVHFIPFPLTYNDTRMPRNWLKIRGPATLSPFRKVDLDLQIVLLPNCKARTGSTNSETVIINVATISWSEATWLDMSRGTSPKTGRTWTSWIFPAETANVSRHRIRTCQNCLGALWKAR